MCLWEIKRIDQNTEELDNTWFRFRDTIKVRLRNGVKIIVDKEWKKNIEDVKRVEDYIITWFVVERENFDVISAYAF